MIFVSVYYPQRPCIWLINPSKDQQQQLIVVPPWQGREVIYRRTVSRIVLFDNDVVAAEEEDGDYDPQPSQPLMPALSGAARSPAATSNYFTASSRRPWCMGGTVNLTRAKKLSYLQPLSNRTCFLVHVVSRHGSVLVLPPAAAAVATPATSARPYFTCVCRES